MLGIIRHIFDYSCIEFIDIVYVFNLRHMGNDFNHPYIIGGILAFIMNEKKLTVLKQN